MAVSAVGTRVWMVLMARFWSYRRSALFCVEQLVFNFRFPISGGRGIVAINCICNSQPALIVAIKPANNYFPAHSGCAVLPVTVLRIPGQLEANNAIISWGNGYIYNKWSTMKPSKHHQIQKQWRRKAVQTAEFAEAACFALSPCLCLPCLVNSLWSNLFSTHSSVLSPSFIPALLCQCGAVLATVATMVTGDGITQCGGWRGTAENNTSGHQMSPSHAPRSRTPVHTNIFIQIHKYFYGPQREFVRLSGAGHSAREEFWLR